MREYNGPLVAPPEQQWLVPFLETEYYRACQTHWDINKATSNCNFYCINCVSPICTYCRKSQKHMNHILLQIRRASHACSVAKGDLVGLIDTAGLHVFRINHVDIHFLCARSSEGSKRKVSSTEDSLCNVCQWVLPGGAADKERPSRFCSIQCKMVYGSSSSAPRVTVGSSMKIMRRAVLTLAGGERRAAIEKTPADDSLGVVGRHGKKRERGDVLNKSVDPETSTEGPALKNNTTSCDEKKMTTLEEKETKKGTHEGSQINGVAVAGDHTAEPELYVNSHNSFRVLQRKSMPHRSAEFAIPDERSSLWFFPW